MYFVGGVDVDFDGVDDVVDIDRRFVSKDVVVLPQKEII